MGFFLPSTVGELCREVSFEPLASSIRFHRVPSLLIWAFRCLHYFSELPQTNRSVSSSAKVYGPVGTRRKSVHALLDALYTSTAHFRRTILPTLSSMAFVILTLKGFWAGVGSKLLLCSTLPSMFGPRRVKPSLAPLASDHFSLYVCVRVLVYVLGGESMIRLLILACLLSKAAWIEETVGHN